MIFYDILPGQLSRGKREIQTEREQLFAYSFQIIGFSVPLLQRKKDLHRTRECAGICFGGVCVCLRQGVVEGQYPFSVVLGIDTQYWSRRAYTRRISCVSSLGGPT